MKMIVLLIVLLCMPFAAEAEELPTEMLALCEAAYPGSAPAAWYGWADDEAGQILLALEQEERFILCMAEKRPREVWQLTLQAPKALDDGKAPDLYLDTDGDTLFFSYWEGEKKITYSSSRAPSGGKEWGPVSAIVYDGLDQWTAWGHEGVWYVEYMRVDENDNILESTSFSKAMGPEWEKDLKLEKYQAGSLPLYPDSWQ
ncbi:MAG: hypothetical protein IJ461_02740 [Clostridia bacterium]|nr:hypothetical protein [Clostridia bacterium]